ncbi:discoidin domain-containing protein [Cerasicoccus frondis]|uniref:discoidin domain-containing protein n=1 Tax=Cerasicoccus frondis TaxID=490090 RepID=UPI002852D00F|nr:discoidin domain-containing protein [Cerasicoccus frondis]
MCGSLLFAGLANAVPHRSEPINLALNSTARASSTHLENVATNAVDGDTGDDSRWVSELNTGKAEWLEITFNEPVAIGGIHLYSGYQNRDAISDFEVQFWAQGEWLTIPSATITDNHATALRVPFDAAVEVTTDKLRLYIDEVDHHAARVKEIMVWPYRKEGIPPLGGKDQNQYADIPKIYLNQSGFNRGKPKRFTAPLAEKGASFWITENGQETVLYRGELQEQWGDFSDFEPEGDAEYVVHIGAEKSVPFRIGNWWLERVSYQGMVDFMVDSRHYVGNHRGVCIGSFAWRDDHHFGYELNSLVPMLLSNPDAYTRMAKQVTYESPRDGLWGALEPYDPEAPDLVKLIHWGADVIVTQQLKHMMLKEQLAYFLYAWPLLKEWLPQQNYDVVKAYALGAWTEEEIDRQYRYDETEENHNLLEVKRQIGTTKGANPPGHSILPNLLMYTVALRDGDPAAERFFNAAYAQTQWVIDDVDFRDPITTKGQRMSEHATILGLAAMAQFYPERAPRGLRAKLNDWARIMIERSDNMWDFRRLSETQWTPTGELHTHWNEPGNVMGFPACVLAVMPFVDSPDERVRLSEIAWAHFDNAFGRNPAGRHFSYDAPREIEGVEFGWYSYHEGGIGQLAEARFVFDGSPKNQHYPYHPEVGDVGWSEGWVTFNTAYNLSLSYLALSETAIEASWNGRVLTVRLKAPINFDYGQIEHAKIRVLLMDGSEQLMTVTEESVDSPYLAGELELTNAPHSVAYGYGYFETRVSLQPSAAALE